MTAQEVPVDRRQYCREGVIGQLEDITYAVLRKYGVMGEVKPVQATSSTEPTAAIN